MTDKAIIETVEYLKNNGVNDPEDQKILALYILKQALSSGRECFHSVCCLCAVSPEEVPGESLEVHNKKATISAAAQLGEVPMPKPGGDYPLDISYLTHNYNKDAHTKTRYK